MRVTYHPQVFDVRNIDQAREIILTGGGSTTDERWVTETPWLADEISNSMAISPDSIIIDYGCGIGRMAKELIDRDGIPPLDRTPKDLVGIIFWAAYRK